MKFNTIKKIETTSEVDKSYRPGSYVEVQVLDGEKIVSSKIVPCSSFTGPGGGVCVDCTRLRIGPGPVSDGSTMSMTVDVHPVINTDYFAFRLRDSISPSNGMIDIQSIWAKITNAAETVDIVNIAYDNYNGLEDEYLVIVYFNDLDGFSMDSAFSIDVFFNIVTNTITKRVENDTVVMTNAMPIGTDTGTVCSDSQLVGETRFPNAGPSPRRAPGNTETDTYLTKGKCGTYATISNPMYGDRKCRKVVIDTSTMDSFFFDVDSVYVDGASSVEYSQIGATEKNGFELTICYDSLPKVMNIHIMGMTTKTPEELNGIGETMALEFNPVGFKYSKIYLNVSCNDVDNITDTEPFDPTPDIGTFDPCLADCTSATFIQDECNGDAFAFGKALYKPCMLPAGNDSCDIPEEEDETCDMIVAPFDKFYEWPENAGGG